jgi:hypothetical protein
MSRRRPGYSTSTRPADTAARIQQILSDEIGIAPRAVADGPCATVAKRMTAKPPIFDFLRSRGARMSCPFCGHEDWHGWDERVTLDHAIGSGTVDRRGEAFPLTCANCGFVRLQSAHVLDDPRDRSRSTGSA